MNVHEQDCLRAFLRDCCVDLRVGIHDYEKKKPQTIIVNVEVETILSIRFEDLTENTTARVLDYQMLYRFIHDELPKFGHIPLLEIVAEQIIAFCFRDTRIRKVRVRLEKPNIFQGTAGAGVEMQRVRHLS